MSPTKNIERGTPIAKHDTPPKRYPKGRRCQRGNKCKTYEQLLRSGQSPEAGILSAYATPTGGDTHGVLLCEPCLSAWRVEQEQGVSLWKFSGTEKKGRTTSYELTALRAVRKSQQLRVPDLACLAECSSDAVKKIERGELRASTKLAGKLARALGVSVDELRGL